MSCLGQGHFRSFAVTKVASVPSMDAGKADGHHYMHLHPLTTHEVSTMAPLDQPTEKSNSWERTVWPEAGLSRIGDILLDFESK